MTILRAYQQQCLAALREARQASPDVTRLAVEMATGLGKTITLAAEIDEWLTESRDYECIHGSRECCADYGTRERALVLVHTDELVRQAVAKIRFVTRDRWTVGVVKAEQNEVTADIVVASVQTLANPERRRQIQNVGKIIVDEAHHGVAKTYLDILQHFGAMDLTCPECGGECLHPDLHGYLDSSSKVQYNTGYDSSGIREHVDQTGSQAPSRASRTGSLERIGTQGLAQRSTGASDDSHLRRRGGRSGGRVRPIPVTGYTATLSRTDGRGLGHVWQDLAFSRSLPWAIRQGHLIDLVPYTISIPGVDAGSSDRVLDGVLAESIAPEAVVDAWFDYARYGGTPTPPCTDCDGPAGSNWRAGCEGCAEHRYDTTEGAPSTVLFAPLVRSAEAFADAFSNRGVKAEVVHGALPAAERQAILARYEAGVTTVICNAMVLTEGWDSPRTSCVIVARPTQSVPLFVQMVGRGMRPWLDAEAPPREEQRCVLLCVAGTATDLVTVADLSDRIGEVKDGQSFLAMEDQWDLGKDIEPEDNAWRGPVRVEQWDAMVRASSKAWKYTTGGVPFLPTAKSGQGYVFVVEKAGEWQVWSRSTAIPPLGGARRAVVRIETIAPDLELALAAAEDVAIELGGDIGALLADKGRPWRKAVPSPEMIEHARRVGVTYEQVEKILTSRAGGKAGKLSDLIDRVTASGVLDRVAVKIKERGKIG